MDPFAAISLASNILSFIDFGKQLLRGIGEINGLGALEEDLSRQMIAEEMNKFATTLLVAHTDVSSSEDKTLCSLAMECQKLSVELVDLLEKLKPKARSRSQSVWSALKNKVHEKEKLNLEQRLDYCRSQLELQLNFRLSRETARKLDSLTSSTATQLSALLAASDDNVSKLHTLQHLIAQRQILNSLAFEGMHGRYDTIEEAHLETFQWIFDESDSENDWKCTEIRSQPSADVMQHGSQHAQPPTFDEETKYQSQLPFLSWLSSGTGIYHVSGKHGSGKSTLMKFLITHPGTMSRLREWAGERTLAFAHFFFWALGSKRQRSLSGLYSGLLHDILQALPELIPLAFPELWQQSLSKPWQTMERFEISDQEARKAFVRLIGRPHSNAEHCFCFFIDGLDEFQETMQDDHKAMVDLLCDWADSSQGTVKLCVSSREHNVFMNAFPSNRRLRLHQLTHQDMERFIRNKLGHISEEDGIDTLTEAIISKAQGIFLWVALVVKDIRELFENGSDVKSALKDIDMIPDELDGLFGHIFRSLTRQTRKKAYQTLLMLSELNRMQSEFPGFDLKLSLFAYSFLEEYGNDPSLALSESFPQTNTGGSIWGERVKLAERRLAGWCKGLVEPDDTLDLVFTHRTILEFLQTPAVTADIITHTSDFDSLDAISQLILAELRLGLSRYADFSSYAGQAFLPDLMLMRQSNGLDQPPYAFLERLTSSLEPSLWGLSHPADGGVEEVTQLFVGKFRLCSTGNWKSGIRPLNRNLLSPMYVLTYLGYHDYPAWKIRHDKATTDSDSKVAILALCCAAYGRGLRQPIGNGPGNCDLSILRMLLERGLLSPNTVTHFHAVSAVSSDADPDVQITVLHQCVLHYIMAFHVMNHEMRSWHSQVLETLLKYEPDLDFTVTLQASSSNSVLELRIGKFGQKASFHMGRRCHREIGYTDLSLREWIAISGLEDHSRLLRVIDSIQTQPTETQKAYTLNQGAETPVKIIRVASNAAWFWKVLVGAFATLLVAYLANKCSS